jgi:hypothetical protein
MDSFGSDHERRSGAWTRVFEGVENGHPVILVLKDLYLTQWEIHEDL